jgi:hypothetical protein
MDGARTLAKALGLKEIKTLPASAKERFIVVVGADWTDPVAVKVKKKSANTFYGPTDGRNADEKQCSPV